MNLFEIEKTPIEDLLVVNTLTHKDDRGHFVKTFDGETFEEFGIPTEFAQIDQSKSKKGAHLRTLFPE